MKQRVAWAAAPAQHSAHTSYQAHCTWPTQSTTSDPWPALRPRLYLEHLHLHLHVRRGSRVTTAAVLLGQVVVHCGAHVLPELLRHVLREGRHDGVQCLLRREKTRVTVRKNVNEQVHSQLSIHNISIAKT